ncbi:hypothetical protein GCM10009550_73270 [Actinocorallia libanotica]|uniref:Uncharacterized protein n=1 Tax=Actinocorallia libanotica TaxID=46162 RepID=A0ABN1RZ03_9ACTN
MVGINGTAGVDDRLMSTASVGTQIVAHYTDINALTYFHWWKDGEQRTMFEYPATRSGTTPDALVEAMHRVGIDTVNGTFSVTANLALAEEVTGIRITEDLLDNAVYTSSLIELPSEDWNSVVIDITDAHGERTHRELTREQAEHAWNQARAKDNQPIPLDAIARDEPGAS